MFASCPTLHSLRIDDGSGTDAGSGLARAPSAVSPAWALRHLDIYGDAGLIRGLLPHLTLFKTPLSPVLRQPHFVNRWSFSAAQALMPLANRLDVFAAPDGCDVDDAFKALLLAMTSAHTLELHHSIIKAAHRALKLQPLVELRQITIGGVAATVKDCPVARIVWRLSHLPSAFGSLHLPEQLAEL